MFFTCHENVSYPQLVYVHSFIINLYSYEKKLLILFQTKQGLRLVNTATVCDFNSFYSSVFAEKLLDKAPFN
ncbi:hypothetical protein BWI97_23755 [Siphonobacter sp. BAB-5405]|nr:hypothetical protein BWI97_23755 [Siphonobacter sp. BAB-5405]